MRLAARSRSRSRSLGPISTLAAVLLGLGTAPRAMAQSAPRDRGCPAAIAPLVEQLLADLPSYANRIIQRQREVGAPARLYIMVAGAAEIEPWPAAETEAPWAASRPLPPPGPSPSSAEPDRYPPARYQVFFTTLERQYSPPQGPGPEAPSQQSQSLQQFHWLILSQPSSPSLPPWQLLSLRSQLASYAPAEATPEATPEATSSAALAAPSLLSPPRDARQGAIAQAIALWLRDCEAL